MKVAYFQVEEKFIKRAETENTSPVSDGLLGLMRKHNCAKYYVDKVGILTTLINTIKQNNEIKEIVVLNIHSSLDKISKTNLQKLIVFLHKREIVMKDINGLTITQVFGECDVTSDYFIKYSEELEKSLLRLNSKHDYINNAAHYNLAVEGLRLNLVAGLSESKAAKCVGLPVDIIRYMKDSSALNCKVTNRRAKTMESLSFFAHSNLSKKEIAEIIGKSYSTVTRNIPLTYKEDERKSHYYKREYDLI